MILAAFILAVVVGAVSIFERSWMPVLLAVAIMLMTWESVFH